MPEHHWMLAKTLEPSLGDSRALLMQGQRREVKGLPPLPSMAEDSLVLLRAAGGSWDLALPLNSTEPWPEDLPAPAAWGPAQSRRGALALRVRGAWSIDPDGRPCELGWAELEGRVRLVSYAGWTLASLERLDLPFSLHEVGGERLMVIGEDARAKGRELKAPLSLPDRDLPDWVLDMGWGLEAEAQDMPAEAVAAPPARPAPAPAPAPAPERAPEPAPAPPPEVQGTLPLFGFMAEAPRKRRR